MTLQGENRKQLNNIIISSAEITAALGRSYRHSLNCTFIQATLASVLSCYVAQCKKILLFTFYQKNNSPRDLRLVLRRKKNLLKNRQRVNYSKITEARIPWYLLSMNSYLHRKLPFRVPILSFLFPPQGHLYKWGPLVQDCASLLTGLDTENPFSFPALILGKTTFPSFSHALYNMGTRKGVTHRRNLCPREVQSPAGNLSTFPEMGMERMASLLEPNKPRACACTGDSLQCPQVTNSGHNLSAYRGHSQCLMI